MLPALPVGLAVSAIIALGVIDRHRENYSGLMADGLWAQLTPAIAPYSVSSQRKLGPNSQPAPVDKWVPAFAGMTTGG